MPNSRSLDLYSGVDPDVERSKSFADAELKAYWELVQGHERSDFLEHGNRVVEIVRSYADGLVSPFVYQVALLHDLVDRMMHCGDDDPRFRAAATAIYKYLSELTNNEDGYESHIGDFISHNLADLTSIENYAEKYRIEMAHKDETMREFIQNKDSREPLGSEMWRYELPYINLENLRESALVHNIEAVIIKAAEAIDNLVHPAPNGYALLQDILEAESYYAPLCESMGLDAMAMKLRSEATKRRLEKLGKKDVIDRALQLRKSALESGFQEKLPGILGANAIDYDFSPSVSFNLEDDHSILMSGTIIGGQFNGAELRLRLKSVGSIAKKIDKDLAKHPEFGGRDPLDIIGITIISHTDEVSSDRFSQGLQLVDASPEMSLEIAPSKATPAFVQGDKDFIAKFDSPDEHVSLGKEIQEIDGKPDPFPYKVAKFTGRYREKVPFEVQFLTAQDRKAARVGMTAHILFKLAEFKERKIKYTEDEAEDLIKQLTDMYERRDHIDKSAKNINKRSRLNIGPFMDRMFYGLAA